MDTIVAGINSKVRVVKDLGKSFSLTFTAKAQYSEGTVGPLTCVTCPPTFMQFTGQIIANQPVQRFYY